MLPCYVVFAVTNIGKIAVAANLCPGNPLYVVPERGRGRGPNTHQSGQLKIALIIDSYARERRLVDCILYSFSSGMEATGILCLVYLVDAEVFETECLVISPRFPPLYFPPAPGTGAGCMYSRAGVWRHPIPHPGRSTSRCVQVRPRRT